MDRTYKKRIAKPNLPKKARNDAKSGSSPIEYQRLDEIRSSTIKTKTTTKTNTKTNEIWSTTIKPAELDQADGLFDDENHELLSAPNTTPRPTGVRS